jgi:hypothetical protein
MLESAGAREEQRKLDSERAQQKSLAEQHLENVAAGKGKGPADPEVKQNFSKGRLGEGDEIALDKERLKAAIAAEKKRKGVTDEDEAWNQAKRSKTDVTEEDMGKSTSVILIKRITVLTSFHEQRPTDLPVQRPSTIPWPITRTTSYSDRGSSIFLTSYPRDILVSAQIVVFHSNISMYSPHSIYARLASRLCYAPSAHGHRRARAYRWLGLQIRFDRPATLKYGACWYDQEVASRLNPKPFQ